jgi:hypothetical protein
MSSSVSYAYTIRQEALRRQAEERAARDAFEGAWRRQEQLREEALALHAVWGDAIEVPAAVEAASASRGVAQWRSLQSAVEKQTRAARERLASQLTAARVAAIEAGMTRLGSADSKPIDAAAVLAARRAEAERAVEESERKDEEEAERELESTVVRLVARLDADAPPQEVTRVERATLAAREARSASGREQSLDALRAQVQAANAAAAAVRERAAEIDRLEANLDGCPGPQADAVRELLSSLRPRPEPLPSGLGAMVAAALEDGDRRARSAYVAAELGKALTEMGYELGPEFTTTLATSGRALATRPSWQGYGVAVSCSGDPARLDLDVVRGEASRADQAARDLEVEREFCAGRPALLDHLAAAGIDASQSRITAEGTAQLRVEPGLFAEQHGEQHAAEPRAKEMER